MKRIFHHPPAATGKAYWRSLEELADSPEFHRWAEREFPEGASELASDGYSRRHFLKFMGASLALAGLGLSGCRRPEAHFVPYTKTPEWLVPGRHLRYSTFMPRRRGGLPLQVTTFNGRPTKIEGHLLHAMSRGATDAFAQASVLDLYDPDRSRRFLKGRTGATEADFFAELEKWRLAWAAKKGAGLAFLVDQASSPTRERLREMILKQFPQALWAAYEPLLPGGDAEAAQAATGADIQWMPQYARAEVVFSLACDFLGNEDDGGLAAIRDFTSARRVEKPGDKMNRLYVAESRYTLTGGMAEHRLRLPEGQMGALALALAEELCAQGVGAGLDALLRAAGGAGHLQGVSPTWIRESARDLLAHRGRCLVVVGARQLASVHVLVAAINQALGNFGATLKAVRRPTPSTPGISELAEAIRKGAVSDLIVLGGNPVYNAPSDLEWERLQSTVRNVVRLGLHEDETSRASAWHVPAAHYLEAWGDAFARDGSHLCAQPMIVPLYGGLSELDLLARVAGLPKPDGPELVRETFRLRYGTGVDALDLDASWTRFVHDGFREGSAAAEVPVLVNMARCADFLVSHPLPKAVDGAGRFELVFAPDSHVDDGRFNNNGWMQEMPDPLTKLTWENAALMSPATAKALGVESRAIKGITTCDVIRISLDGRQIEAPVMVAPGHVDGSITLSLGYGRTKTGRVGAGSGFNAYVLRTSQNPGFVSGATAEKTGRRVEVGVTQEHQAMEGRALVREAPLAFFEKEPNFPEKMGMEAHVPPPESIYKNPPLNAPHQWAMTIDLNRCIGCTACALACQSENNIPVVGKDQVMRGREMNWIRLDRYFSGPEDEPQMLTQPIACMQCENAPCETVCPVNATVHNDEGLNVMAYNRCIGTRYCANNCPYKVRRFNFFDYNQRQTDKLYLGPLGPKGSPETIQMQKNPNVTVRMRGVMEKCTFCVQRIEASKIDQLVKAGASPDTLVPANSIKTACQQVCPAEAIVFGNMADPKSEVARLKTLPHDYGMLEYLNVKPRLTYLARLRNPNMRMPGAELIGMSTLGELLGHEAQHEHPTGPMHPPHTQGGGH